MKSVTRIVTLFFAMLFASFSSLAFQDAVVPTADKNFVTSHVSLPPIATTEKMVVKKGFVLWHHFDSLGIVEKDKKSQWTAVCERSQVPCTDSWWRNLPIETVLVVPRDASDILADEAARDHKQSVAREVARRAELSAVQKELVVTQHRFSVVAFALVFAIVLIFLLLAAVLLLRDKAVREEREKEELLQRLKSLRLEDPHVIGGESHGCCVSQADNVRPCSSDGARGDGCCGGGKSSSETDTHECGCGHGTTEGDTTPNVHQQKDGAGS